MTVGDEVAASKAESGQKAGSVTQDAAISDTWRIRRAYWMLIATMIPLAILSQFFRASNAVIAPNLMVDLNLSESQVASLSSAFFFIFAPLQIPIGILLDRVNNRLLLAWMMLPAVAGALLFGLADSYGGLLAARLLLGFGCAGWMVGSLVILSRWLPSANYAAAMALLFAWANAGHLFSGAPLGYATVWWGWRESFLVLAGVTAVFALVFVLLVRDAPPRHAFHSRKPESLGESLRGLLKVWRQREVLLILPMIMVGYGVVKAILSLWGGTYFEQVFGLAEAGRGSLLSLVSLAMIVGTMFYGPLDRRFNTRKGVVIVGALATAATLAILALWPQPPLWAAASLLCAFAFLGGYSLVTMVHGLALIPKHLTGRGVTTLNVGLMGGAALIQIGTGPLVENLLQRPGVPSEAAYQALFWVLAGVTLAALVVYLWLPDRRPKDS